MPLLPISTLARSLFSPVPTPSLCTSHMPIHSLIHSYPLSKNYPFQTQLIQWKTGRWQAGSSQGFPFVSLLYMFSSVLVLRYECKIQAWETSSIEHLSRGRISLREGSVSVPMNESIPSTGVPFSSFPLSHTLWFFTMKCYLHELGFPRCQTFRHFLEVTQRLVSCLLVVSISLLCSTSLCGIGSSSC